MRVIKKAVVLCTCYSGEVSTNVLLRSFCHKMMIIHKFIYRHKLQVTLLISLAIPFCKLQNGQKAFLIPKCFGNHYFIGF